MTWLDTLKLAASITAALSAVGAACVWLLSPRINQWWDRKYVAANTDWVKQSLEWRKGMEERMSKQEDFNRDFTNTLRHITSVMDAMEKRQTDALERQARSMERFADAVDATKQAVSRIEGRLEAEARLIRPPS